MSGFTLQVVPCGGNEHRLDLQSFRSRGLPVPHHYSTWPLSSRTATWSWCRVLDPQGHLLGAYAIELTPSRALPGTRIGRVERLGRMLHAEALGVIGQALAETARQLPRLQRLDVHLFDEDARRRGRYSDAIMAAGGVARPEMFGYDRTLVVELPPSSEQLMATFSTSTRRNVRHASRQPGYVIEPIREASYVPRIRELAIEAFHRTGGEPGQLDVDGMLLDAVRGEESRLVGVFRRDGGPPGNLVAFAWGRLHGDYAVYEMGATHRAIELRRLSPGYGLVWSLMTWARERGARWFDLGGTLEAELAANHPLHGILSFKRGFSAEERVVAHEFSFGSDSLLSALARTSRDVARALSIRR